MTTYETIKLLKKVYCHLRYVVNLFFFIFQIILKIEITQGLCCFFIFGK